jgi:hypothetical protein
MDPRLGGPYKVIIDQWILALEVWSSAGAIGVERVDIQGEAREGRGVNSIADP